MSTSTGKATPPLPLAYSQDGDGLPLIFLHGMTYDRRMWKPLIEQLRGSFKCVNVDLPGHGESPARASYDLQEVAADVHQLVEQLKLVQPLIVGHSMGALVAAFCAALYSTSGLITVDQPLYVVPFVRRIQSLRNELDGPAFAQVWKTIEAELRPDLIPKPRRTLVEGASNPNQRLVLGYWREARELPVDELQARLTGTFSRIKVPYTAIFGARVGQDYRQWLSKVVPQARIVEFPGSGHFPHLVDPSRTAAVIKELADSTAALTKTGGA